MLLANLLSQNPAAHIQALQSMFSAGAHGAARSAWIEINRPLTALGLNAPLSGALSGNQLPTGTGSGNVLTLPVVSLPIGMDIKSITCIATDIDNGWQAVNFTFGTLNLVNPQGTYGGVNLSMFDPRLEHEDRLAPWILSKTKVDVQVTAQLQNGAFYGVFSGATGVVSAVFHGFSLNAFQEEQVCAIQTRIEPTDRNIGNAELIGHFRQVVGAGLALQIPAYQQSPSQIGRVPVLNPQYQQVSPLMGQQPLLGRQPLMQRQGFGAPLSYANPVNFT